jgi:hypothetical protein
MIFGRGYRVIAVLRKSPIATAAYWIFFRQMEARRISIHRRLSFFMFYGEIFGGASRDRTDDLIVANDALSQLSYSPLFGVIDKSSLSALSNRHQVRRIQTLT